MYKDCIRLQIKHCLVLSCLVYQRVGVSGLSAGKILATLRSDNVYM